MTKAQYSFPADPSHRSFIRLLYQNEIERRAQWVIDATVEYSDAHQQMMASEFNPNLSDAVIRKALEIVSHATALAHLFDASGGKRKDRRERALGRVQMLQEEWPEVPPPPSSLREVRNHFEHMDEKMDQWAMTVTAGYRAWAYIDMVVGPPYERGIHRDDHFRRLHNHVLYFWGDAVSLEEVTWWAFVVSLHVGRPVRWPN